MGIHSNYPAGAGIVSRYDDEATCTDCGEPVAVEIRAELGFTETVPEDCPACGGRLEVE